MTKNLRVSPQKLNLLAQMIRGKKVDTALAELEFSRKRIAKDVRKCVMSAVANAENNHGLDVNDLVVKEAYVGKNLVITRFHARGRGRMSPIEKPFAQLTVVVKAQEEEAAQAEGGRIMGHKVNPIGLRVGINRTWDSRWFASRGEYGRLLHEDMHIRDHILKQRRQAGISKVVIERPHKKCRVTVHTARPGVLIGKKGADIEKLRGELARLTASEVHLNIVEVRKPEIDATLVAETIAQQLERRVAFRRAMKRSVQSAIRLGRPRHPHQLLGAARRRRDRARGVVSRGPRAAAHAARRHRFRLRPRQDRVRRHRRQGVDLQGRDHGARPDGGREARHRGPGGRWRWPAPWRRRWRRPRGRLDRRRAPGRAGQGLRIERPCCNQHAPSTARPSRAASTARPRAARTLNFGSHGLKAVEPERITARQIEAARRAITRAMKRAGRVWIRIFPDVPVTKKPAEVRMGSGKGAPELWVARVKPGRIMFELDGVNEATAREALELGAAKLPIKTRIVRRQA